MAYSRSDRLWRRCLPRDGGTRHCRTVPSTSELNDPIRKGSNVLSVLTDERWYVRLLKMVMNTGLGWLEVVATYTLHAQTDIALYPMFVEIKRRYAYPARLRRVKDGRWISLDRACLTTLPNSI
jgi:hypothetical protein